MEKNSMTSPERGAHTAGPWAMHPSFPEYIVPAHHIGRAVGFAADAIHDRDHYAQVIAVVGDDRHGRGTRAANARLIAAAPEMLDTIHTALADVERAIACTPIGSAAETILDDIAIRLRAAVAAAEGGGRG